MLVTVVERILTGREIVDLTFGILGTLAATAVNLALGLHLVRTGRRGQSEVLVADGQHVLADAWTSVGVVAGLLLVWLTGLEWLDWAVAAVVGVHLLRVGARLVRSGIAGLMDEVDEADYATVLAAVNRVREPDWLDMHDLRLRRVGDLIHVDFHLVVPAEWTIARGHEVSALLEERCSPSWARTPSSSTSITPDRSGTEARSPRADFSVSPPCRGQRRA